MLCGTAHGGKITFSSLSSPPSKPPGEATTFHLHFPVLNAEAPAPTAALPSVPWGHGATGEHILFVDDELALVQLCKKVLEGLGYQVTTKTSALAALGIRLPDPL